MRKRWLPAFVASAAAATAVMVLSGAGAAANGPSLSSGQAIDAYLQSAGIDPSAAVRQDGDRNYAGPSCPGNGWSCTTSSVVVQTASAGGSNLAECAAAKCVFVQVGPDNDGRCVRRDDAVQDCTLSQTGARNEALFEMQVDQNGGSAQDASQTASLDQTTDGGFNHAVIRQSIKQDTHEGDSQTQNAAQSVVVVQTATNGAENNLHVDQTQDQSAQGGTTLDQNAEAASLPDCYPFHFPNAPNQCANIEQSSKAGNNDSHLKQSVKQDGKTDAQATQEQGTFDAGMEARIHQATDTGRSHNDANQDKDQNLTAAAGSTQTQFDPLFCCGAGSQFGGSDNRESIDQASSQDASEADAFQESSLLGQSLTPDGSCSISQHASNNIDSATNSFAVEPCPFVLLATACGSGGIDRIDQQQQVTGCTAFPPILTPPDIDLTDKAPLLRLLARRQG
jgi:hypothetical protein